MAINQRLKDWYNSPVLLVLFVIVAVACLSVVAYVCLFAHPSLTDDYGNSMWANYGEKVLFVYTQYSGRYTQNFLAPLCPMHWASITGYRLAILALFILFAIALGWFMKKALTTYTDTSRRVTTLASIATVLLVINNIVSVSEGFYWYTGSIVYTLPSALLLILMSIFIQIDKSERGRPSKPQYLASILLVVTIIGCNEVILVLCDSICFALYAYYHIGKRKKISKYFLLLSILSLICSAVALLAPGNSKREAFTEVNLLTAISKWLYDNQKLVYEWMLNPYLLVYSIFILSLPIRLRFKDSSNGILKAFLAVFVIVYLLCIPVYYGMGGPPPPRIYNVLFLFFALGWTNFLLRLSDYMHRITNISAMVKQLAAVAVAVVLLFSINNHNLRASNVYYAAKGLANGTFQRYDQELQERYRIIASTTLDTVRVPSITRGIDNIIFSGDFTSDPRTVKSLIGGQLFHKMSICLISDTAVVR